MGENLPSEHKIRYLLHMLSWRLFEVFFLGFLCGLIPGPVVTALFTDTIRTGWASARRIVFLAAGGELVMSIVCVAALSALDAHSKIFAALSVFGALILLNLAWDLWKVGEIPEEEPLFSNRRIFTIALLNGMAWIFWITVCTPQAMALDQVLKGGRWIFIALFELGWICSTLSLCYLFGLFRGYFHNQHKLHILYRTVAILFVVFGLKLAMGTWKLLLN